MACRGSSTMAGNHGVGSLGMKQLDRAKLDGDVRKLEDGAISQLLLTCSSVVDPAPIQKGDAGC
uniref:Uncharacterized protein n=1 Tax=Oryza barthii TaxID=65489 RepID=A0A0D3HD48_9ORYZ